jgi:cytochrome c oxidase cbb3-type subunit III
MKAIALIAGSGIVVAALLFGSEQQTAAQSEKADSELRLGEIMAGSQHEHKGSAAGEEYEGKDKHIRAGMKLYHKLNCVGCHFDGGGGIGPALIDDAWVYGSSIDHIAASIRDGRPNGMPSFHAIANEKEIWQLAAYVHSGMKEHEHGAETKEEDEGDKKHQEPEGVKEKAGEGETHQHEH